MSFHGAMGITYIAAIIIAAMPVVLILLMKSLKMINLKGAHRYLLVTAICLLLINILYFLIDYYSVITSYYKSGTFIRVFDIWLAITMQCSWYMVLKELLFRESYSVLWQIVKYGYVGSLLVSMINYGWIMDDGYVVSDSALKSYALIMDLVVALFLTAINIICIILITKKLLNKGKTQGVVKFTLAATVFVTADGLQNTKASVNLILGNIVLFQYDGGIVNLTAIIRLLFGLCLLWYAVRYCFFKPSEGRADADVGKNPDDDRKTIEALAVEKGLTEREKDIVKLLFEGATYQEMANDLYISKNTVKHHVTNIYRKLGVGSKDEMIDIFRKNTRQ